MADGLGMLSQRKRKGSRGVRRKQIGTLADSSKMPSTWAALYQRSARPAGSSASYPSFPESKSHTFE
ncbi:hypothetical protein N7539_006889 [Penicillium diatomitis]|uniref:Uncharacterized protein n=1 Tax=Penicillium diatomitis TaxID=2819901 RepID=A0A9X0BSC9_9EURO|nr:uncharacterized protein N7539_006889 [Penicillium diatomitis]KAJ5480995.1 hypothetical protein N7539_006889 [Penicillium diatomitis]